MSLVEIPEKLLTKCKIGCINRVSKDHFYYNWTVNNLIQNFDPSISVCIQSPEFTTGANQGNVWYLQLILHKDSLAIDVQLYLVSCKDPSKLNFRLSMLDKENKKIHEKEESINTLCEGAIVCKFNNFIEERSRINVQKLLAINKLTLLCEIMNSSTKKVKITNYSKTDDLKSFLMNEKLSDVILSVGESKFNLHKAILASRSPVFLAMFEHDTMENRENIVRITDVDEKTMKTIVLYIYTDEVENLEESASDILIAADKYGIEGLKSACSEHLSNSLTNDNAFETLVLADIYNFEELKFNTLTYIASHLTEMIDTPGYALVQTKYQHLINNILVAASKIIV